MIGTGIAVVTVSLYHSLLVDRYLLLVAPGAALMAAQGALAIRRANLAVAVLCLAVLLHTGIVVTNGGHYRTDNWRQAEEFVAAKSRPNDGAIFAPIVKVVAFEFYVLKHHDQWPVSVVPPGQWGATRVVFGEVDKPSAVERSATTIVKRPRIWLIIGRGLGGGPERDYLRAARAALDDRSRTGSWSFGEVDVELYE